MSFNKLLILDGSSVLVRAYFANSYNGHIRRTSQGTYTNAVLGFLNMMFAAIDTIRPTHLFVAWDVSRDTFRRELYSDYKGTRGELPDELLEQFGTMQDVLQCFGIAQHRDEKFEADDIIGTFATLAASKGADVVIVTGDRDALQLVRENITVCIMKKGTREMAYYTPDSLFEQYGLTASQIIDLKALMGDTSDNIPGIPGIGEKTATKLLQQFGSIERLLAETASLSGKLKEKVETNQHLAKLSKQLATIVLDVPLPHTLETCPFTLNGPQAKMKLEELELHRIHDQLMKYVDAV